MAEALTGSILPRHDGTMNPRYKYHLSYWPKASQKRCAIVTYKRKNISYKPKQQQSFFTLPRQRCRSPWGSVPYHEPTTDPYHNQCGCTCDSSDMPCPCYHLHPVSLLQKCFLISFGIGNSLDTLSGEKQSPLVHWFKAVPVSKKGVWTKFTPRLGVLRLV